MSELNNFTVTVSDAPPTLWTDALISGTEFMTHRQGQGGFEIHFRTDDMSKYEAVQNECRRQIDHGKPSADLRPVVRGKWVPVGTDDMDEGMFRCSECGSEHFFPEILIGIPADNFCSNCGADMRESN